MLIKVPLTTPTKQMLRAVATGRMRAHSTAPYTGYSTNSDQVTIAQCRQGSAAVTCERLPSSDGLHRLFVCVRGCKKKAPPCADCGRPSTKQCDYPLRGKKAGKTCDRHLCDACAVVIGYEGGESVDYCDAHPVPCPELGAEHFDLYEPPEDEQLTLF